MLDHRLRAVREGEGNSSISPAATRDRGGGVRDRGRDDCPDRLREWARAEAC